MTIWEEILKLIVNDVLIGLNFAIILYIILHFIKKYILPKIPQWLKEYRMITKEKDSVERAREVMESYK